LPSEDNMYIFAIDTSTKISSLGVFYGREPVITLYVDRGVVKGENLILLVDYLIGKAGITRQDLNGVVVGIGPGSFTGIRIALSIAKAMAYADNLLIKGVRTMDAIALELQGISSLVSPLLSATSGKYFTALYSVGDDLKCIEDVSLCNLDEWVQMLTQRYRDREIIFILDERRVEDAPILTSSSKLYGVIESKMFPKVEMLVKLFYRYMEKDDLDSPFTLLPMYYRPSAAEEKISK